MLYLAQGDEGFNLLPWGIGFLILTGLYKIAITVREEIDVL